MGQVFFAFAFGSEFFLDFWRCAWGGVGVKLFPSSPLSIHFLK